MKQPKTNPTPEIEDIPAMEAALEGAGIKLQDFQSRAGIHPSTWWRWKIGRFEPHRSSWRAVVKTYHLMLAEVKAAGEKAKA